MKGLRKLFGKKTIVTMLAVCMALTFASCGSSGTSSYDSAMSSPMEQSAVNGAGGFVEYKAEMESAVVTDELMDSASATESGSTGAVATDRKLIKTVDMHVETQGFDELMATIEEQVTALGGYIESMNTYNGSSYSGYRSVRDADMTLRIPKQNLDAFLNTVSDISNVVRRSDNVEDVTLAYVDLESHRDALRTEQTRLLELLEKAETIEDIITIEERLSNVRYQLESMESQLRTYDNQVDYSTVYLNVEEVEIYTPVEEDTVWERISEGFMESLDNVGEGFVEFGIWFVVNLPYLVVWAVLIAAFIAFVVWLVKHSEKKQKKVSGKAGAYGAQQNVQNTATQNMQQNIRPTETDAQQSGRYFEDTEKENAQK